MAPMGFEGAKSLQTSAGFEHELLETHETVVVSPAEVKQWRDDEFARVQAARKFGQDVVARDLHQLAEDRAARGFGPQAW